MSGEADAAAGFLQGGVCLGRRAQQGFVGDGGEPARRKALQVMHGHRVDGKPVESDIVDSFLVLEPLVPAASCVVGVVAGYEHEPGLGKDGADHADPEGVQGVLEQRLLLGCPELL